MAHARYVRQGHGIWQCFYVEDKGEKTITVKRGQDKGKEKVVRNMIIGCRFCGWKAAWSRQNYTLSAMKHCTHKFTMGVSDVRVIHVPLRFWHFTRIISSNYTSNFTMSITDGTLIE